MSAASGGNSEPKQGQRSQSARGFCPRSTMRVPQPDIIEHFGNADAVPQLPERCLSRKAGIVRCCLKTAPYRARYHVYQTEKRPVKQPVFDGIQVSIGYSSVQVPSTMNRPSDRLISRPTISPGVCRSALRAAYRMSVLFLPCAFSVSFLSASIAARFY